MARMMDGRMLASKSGRDTNETAADSPQGSGSGEQLDHTCVVSDRRGSDGPYRSSSKNPYCQHASNYHQHSHTNKSEKHQDHGNRLPRPITSATKYTTGEMRPRRRLIRLVFYSIAMTLCTALVYSLRFALLDSDPMEEPGVNLAPAKRLGYKQLEDIPHGYVPREHDADVRRLVFIGDVHGMFTELKDLLQKINYDGATDHIVFTGDLVTKGPDSLKVVDFARKHGATCVRGNQDDRVLLHYNHYRAHTTDSLFDSETDLRRKVSKSEEMIRIEKALAKKMTKEQAEWLDACPLILKADGVKGLGNIAVVHAGLVHGIPLRQQDPAALMTMRSIQPRSRVPSSGTDGTHWARLWNRHEKNARVPRTVIYGHYAAKGLDIRPLSKGLDSNCVRGGKLTALVVSTRTDDPEIVSVRCRRYYHK